MRADAPGEIVTTFREGHPFRFGVSVRNSGSFTVRIVGVPVMAMTSPFVGHLFASRSLAKARAVPGPTDRFRPFDLKPGDERLLFIRGVFGHCRDYAGGTGATYTAWPVRFSFLWRTETVWLPLDEPLVIQVPEGHRCASR